MNGYERRGKRKTKGKTMENFLIHTRMTEISERKRESRETKIKPFILVYSTIISEKYIQEVVDTVEWMDVRTEPYLMAYLKERK